MLDNVFCQKGKARAGVLEGERPTISFPHNPGRIPRDPGLANSGYCETQRFFFLATDVNVCRDTVEQQQRI